MRIYLTKLMFSGIIIYENKLRKARIMIYLDNASTTKTSETAKNAVMEAMEQFGNPSSLHGLGIQSEKTVELARERVARKLGTKKANIFFTSGGTEANNLAVLGTVKALRKRGKRVITSEIEHPSVLESFKELEKNGFDVTYLKCMPCGRVDLKQLEDALSEDTILVSVMAVNNETGIIQPIKQISELVHEKSKIAVVHSDCVQAFGKIDCRIKELGADMISISSHKIHGPKGVGALCIEKGRVLPLMFGGQQQMKIRPGTENVPGIAGFGAAACEDYGNCGELYDCLKKGIIENIDNVKINGDEEYTSKCILNVSFIGVRSEILLHSLETHGIYVSTGSACSSKKIGASHVLEAMGLNKKEADGAIRFSFDENITIEDINYVVDALKKEVEIIRNFVR